MKSFLKFLSRNKLYTAIEAAGLAVSLAFVILIGTYAWQQFSVRRENPDRERIYAAGMPTYLGLTYGFPDVAAERIPEIESISRFCTASAYATFGEETFPVDIIATDKAFFDLFPCYTLLSGRPEDLEVPDNVILSESFARKISATDPVGKRIKIGDGEYTVCGIAKDFRNTLVAYADVLASHRSALNEDATSVPFDRFGSTVPFMKVKEGAARAELQTKLDALCKEIYGEFYGSAMFEYVALSRLDELFFRNEGMQDDRFNRCDPARLRLLGLIGLLLLLSAVFNYINLNFALTGKRAREMATRRLVGADKAEIFRKYIQESLAFTALCVTVAVLLAVAFAPVLNRLLGPDVPIRIHLTPAYLAALVGLIIVVGVVCGVLPAWLGSKYQPIDVLKGTFRANSKMVFTKVFIVLQSALAVFLISMAFVMEGQFKASLDRPFHADVAHKYYHLAPVWGARSFELGEVFRQLPCVRAVGRVQGAPGMPANGQFSNTKTGDEILYRLYRTDSTAFRMLGFEVLEDFGAPRYNSVWFGDAAFRATGFDDTFHDISQTLSRRTGGCEQVAGVIADFPTKASNLGSEDYLVVSLNRTEDIKWGAWLLETQGAPGEAQRQIRTAYADWAKKAYGYVPEASFDGFLTDLMRESLQDTHAQMRLVEIFMLIAVLISLLGLVAMSTYYAGERARDIAVRKVFGGTVETETFRSVREYVLLVLAACVLGIPAAVWAAGKYLERFIWKLSGYGWVFAAAALLALAIAFASVLWQTLRAARTNPAEELKKE